MEVGLRERKKLATREALHKAALALAIERGPENVTVEAIADAAEVSRRTFSNYFANKEDALLHGDRTRMRDLVALIAGRPETEPAWAALTHAAGEMYASVNSSDRTWVAQLRLVRRHPLLAARQASLLAEWEREVADEVLRRLGDPDDLTAQVMAAGYLAALRLSVRAWLDRDDGPSLAELIRRALSAMGASFTGGAG